MCWNAPVSITFSIGLYVAAAFLVWQGRKASRDPSSTRYLPAAKWHALIVGNIASVELCEFLIWLDVLPLSAQGQGGHCPTLNKVGTYGVFLTGFVNWMCPGAASLFAALPATLGRIIATWCYMSSSGANAKDRFFIPLVLGVLTSLGYVTKMVLGDGFQLDIDFWDKNPRFTYNASVAVTTCSYNDDVTSFPHLLWRFNMSAVGFLPNAFSWFTVGLLPMFFYKPGGLALVCSIWGSLTYIVPLILLPAEETMSMWVLVPWWWWW